MTTDGSILDKLKKYPESGALPMHMPGHKRNCAFPHIAALGGTLDITEIDGFDDLNDPQGIIAESEKLASRLWGCADTLYSVNGSTGCILAAVAALCPRGSRAVVARNCHRSVYSALEYLGVEPVFAVPPVTEHGLSGSLPPEAVEKALDGAPDAAAVILTSPTYEGALSDIGAICRAAHRRGVPVIADEAHGAHLSLSGVFPEGAVALGADLTVHSLHKTLSSLTGTAALHINGDLADPKAVRAAMRAFSTSSPSYLLIASIDAEVRALSRSCETLVRWKAALDRAKERLAALRVLSAPDLSGDPAVFAADPSKIFVDCSRSGLSGPAVAAALRESGVEVEAAYPRGILAMTGEGDTDATLSRFSDALLSLDATLAPRGTAPGRPAAPTVPPRVLPPDEARRKKRAAVPLGDAVGAVAAEYVFAYPPGVPILVPGERITEDAVAAAEGYLAAGVRLTGVTDGTVETMI